MRRELEEQEKLLEMKRRMFEEDRRRFDEEQKRVSPYGFLLKFIFTS